MSQIILGVEKLYLDKIVEQNIGHSHPYYRFVRPHLILTLK